MARCSWLRVLGAVLVTAFLVAGCGGGDDSDSDVATGDDSAQDDDSTGDGGDDAARYFGANCQAAFAEFVGIQGKLGAAYTGDFSGLEDAQDYFEELADAAPDEIKDAFEVYATELGGFYSALAEVGYNPGEQPTPEQLEQLSQLSQEIDQPALQQASEEISAYFEGGC